MNPDITGTFDIIFHKGNNFWDFLVVFLLINLPSKKEIFSKAKKLWSQVDLFIGGRQNNFDSCPLEVVSIPINVLCACSVTYLILGDLPLLAERSPTGLMLYSLLIFIQQ